MNRNQDSQDYRNNRFDNRSEDRHRGAYRQDTSRGQEYDQLNQRNFNDRDSRQDYRHPDFDGGNRSAQNHRQDHGRDQDRRGERMSNFNSQESNNGLQGASRNFGNMGSYGGAQGWGSSSNGSHQASGQGSQWASGHGRDEGRQVNRQVYGAYRDHNSFAPGEREQYDGTSRYGTQGADASKGWIPAERAGSDSINRREEDRNSSSRRQDDSRYEIYDNAQSHYNRGEYGNQLGGGTYTGSSYDRRTRADGPMLDYNHAPQDHYNQQGEGARSENYGNMAGSLSYGHDRDFRSEEGRERRFNPMSGRVREQGSQPASREDFSW